MPHDSKRGYQIYHSLQGMILTLAIVMWVNEYYVLKVNILVCILYGVFPAILLFVFDKYKKHTVSYLVLLGLLPVGALIFLISRTNPITWLTEIVEWVIRYNRTEDMYEAIWAYTVLAFVSVIGSILFFILVKKLITRLLLVVLIITMFVLFTVMSIHMGKIAVGIGIFYILNIFIELSGMLYSKKTGKKDKKESILYLLPVCILLAIIAAGLPSKNEPIQWTGVKNIYYSIKDQINKLVTEWEFFVGEGEGIFSISLSGYSGDGSLDNQDLVSNKKVALIVTGRRGLSPIYLTGSVNDVYTGFSWEKSKEDSLVNEQEYQIDYAELLYGLSRLDSETLENFRLVETKSMNIIYNNIKTKTFFYPSKSKWFQFDRIKPNLETEYAGITFPKARGDSTTYNIAFYEMNLQEKVFQDMLRKSDSFSYDIDIAIDRERMNRIEGEFFVRDKVNFFLRRENFYELYKERADIIYKSYTQLPENLPMRVKDLAYEITKDEDTKYDKLKAIEKYLLKFEYSFTPGKTPEDSDFVDYFLFDNQKGYCTSYATTMAVLGRSIGIPTRYVEGYVIDYSDKNDTGYLVRNSNAHAWAEAYFDGVGWIPFEATPPFHEERYTAWAPLRRYEESDNSQYYIKEQVVAPVDEATYYEEVKDSKDKRGGALIWVLILTSMVTVLVVILIIYYIVLRRRYLKEFDESNNSMKVNLLFLRILALLKYEGFTLEATETLIMFSDRTKDRYQHMSITFRNVVNIFMAYRYGEMSITDKQFERVSIFYEGLKRKHEKETKALKLHIEEFLFLIKAYSRNTTYQA